MRTGEYTRLVATVFLLSTLGYASSNRNPDCLPGVPCLPDNLAIIDTDEETRAALFLLRVAQKKIPEGICIDYKGNSQFEVGIGTDAFITGTTDPKDVKKFETQIAHVKSVLTDLAHASGKDAVLDLSVVGFADGQHYRNTYAPGKDVTKSVGESKTKNQTLAKARAKKISDLISNGPFKMAEPDGHESAFLEDDYPAMEKGLKCDTRRKVVISAKLQPFAFDKTDKGGVFHPENRGLSGAEMKPIYETLEADVEQAMQESNDPDKVFKSLVANGKMAGACATDPVLSRVTRAAIRLAQYRIKNPNKYWGSDLQEKEREYLCDEFGGVKKATKEENELFYKFIVDKFVNPKTGDPAAEAKKIICGEQGKGIGVVRQYYTGAVIKTTPVTETKQEFSIEGKFDANGKLIQGSIKTDSKNTTTVVSPGSEKNIELKDPVETTDPTEIIVDPISQEKMNSGIMYKEFDGEGTSLLWCYKGHTAKHNKKNSLLGNSISGEDFLKEKMGEKGGVRFSDPTEFDIEFDPDQLAVHKGIGLDDPQGYNKNGGKGVDRRGHVCKVCGHGRDYGFLKKGKRSYDDRLAANGYGDEMIRKSDNLFASDPDSIGAAADPATYVISDCKNCDCNVYDRIRSKKGFEVIRPSENDLHASKKFRKKDFSNACIFIQKVAGACTIGPAYNQTGGNVEGKQMLQFIDPTDGLLKQFENVAHVVEYFKTGQYSSTYCKNCGYDNPKNFQQEINSIACAANKGTKLPTGVGKDAEVFDCKDEIEKRKQAEAKK